MFSRTDANQLRENLPAIDFSQQSESHPLLQSYRDHYGLNFESQELSVAHVAGTFNSGEFQLVCHYYTIPLAHQKGTAFLVHGYFDHAGIYGHLVEHCLRVGFAVVIFDLPGHGLSSGAPASIDSFQEYDQALLEILQEAQRQEVNQPWIVIAQSAGAAVVIDSILCQHLIDRFKFERIILLGPLLRPRNWLKGKVLFPFLKWFINSTDRKFSKNSHNQEFLDFLKNSDELQSQSLQADWIQAMKDYQKRFDRAPSSNQALHIVQGSGDGTVDWQYNLPQLLAKFPASKSFMIADARHHLVNESPEFRNKVFSLIDQIVAEIG